MVRILQAIIFVGGLIIAVFGVGMILIVNYTGHEPEGLRLFLQAVLFISGPATLWMVILRSYQRKNGQ